jgi:hypothetical protein
MNDLAQLFTFTPADPTDDDLPSYSDPGRILFLFIPIPGDPLVESIDYDGNKAPFWLHEGGFMDYAVRDMVDIELEGFYVLEGVTGYVSKDYFGEYDEDWEFELCRRASESEIKSEALE